MLGARGATSRSFAAYAPRVFDAAGQGDAMAADIVSRAASAISELIETLVERKAPRISLVGGMAGAIEPYLRKAVAPLLEPALADSVAGALLLATGRRDPEP